MNTHTATHTEVIDAAHKLSDLRHSMGPRHRPCPEELMERGRAWSEFECTVRRASPADQYYGRQALVARMWYWHEAYGGTLAPR